MKLRFLLLTMILGSLLVNAQDTTLIKIKQQQLDSAKVELNKTMTTIKALESEIESLKPIEKWEIGKLIAINLNQASFTNWAQGGINAISMTALANGYWNYDYDGWTWENNVDLAYGVLRNQDEPIRKNEDKIDLQTKVSRKMSKKFRWAGLGRLETQFAEGFDFNDDNPERPVISNFMAPGYVKLSLGLDYKPNPKLSMYLSPAAGKWTFVMDDSIAVQRLYIPKEHENMNRRAEFGALASVIYQDKELTDNIGLRSSLELFNNYTDLNKPNRKNIDVDWQVRLDMKLGKYIGANLFTHLKYDHDTKIEFDPVNEPGKKGPRTQFKELFGIGFRYKF